MRISVLLIICILNFQYSWSTENKTVEEKFNLIKYFLKNKPDSSLILLNEIQNSKQFISSPEIQGRTYLYCGILQARKTNFKQAISFYNKSDSCYALINDSLGLSRVYNNKGQVYYKQSDYIKALEYFNRSKKIKEKYNDKVGDAICNLNIGDIYYIQGKYLNAEKHQKQALAIFEQTKHKRGIAAAYLSLAKTYEDLLQNTNHIVNDSGNFEIPINYLKKAEVLYKQTKDIISTANVFNNLGNIYSRLNKINESREYYLKELNIRKDFNDLYGIAGAYNNIGLSYYYTGDISIALNYAEKALGINNKIKNQYGISKNYYLLGICYESLNETNKAVKYFNDCYEISKKINMPDMQILASEKLYLFYDENKNYNKAFQFYKVKNQLSDSLKSDKLLKYISDLKITQENIALENKIQQQQQTINIKELENEKKQLQINRFKLLVFAIVFIAGLIIFILLYFYKQKQKLNTIKSQKQKLETGLQYQEQERNKIAEELHDQLGSKLAGASNILNILQSDYPNISILKKISTVVNESYQEVRLKSHQLAQFSATGKSFTGAVNDFIEVINAITVIKIGCNINKPELINSLNVDLLSAAYRSIQELTSNAVKHSKATKLNIELNITDSYLIINIIDDGIGFYINNANNGLGLNSIKNRAMLYAGSFDVKNNNGAEVLLKFKILS